jgi:uncharacterized membrane protein
MDHLVQPLARRRGTASRGRAGADPCTASSNSERAAPGGSTAAGVWVGGFYSWQFLLVC